jgi:uncharacterized protein Usg
VMSLVCRFLPGLRLNSLISFTAIFRWCNLPVPFTQVHVSCTNTESLINPCHHCSNNTVMREHRFWVYTITRIYILLGLSLHPLFYRVMSDSLPQISQPVWWERYTLFESPYTIAHSELWHSQLASSLHTLKFIFNIIIIKLWRNCIHYVLVVCSPKPPYSIKTFNQMNHSSCWMAHVLHTEFSWIWKDDTGIHFRIIPNIMLCTVMYFGSWPIQ